MQRLDDVLAEVGGDQPPMRGLSGALIEIRKSPPPGLHTLTSKSADPEQREDQADIPPPPEPLMHELDNAETSMLVEKHIEFQKRDRFGALTTVRLPTVFLSPYRTFYGSKLPVCVAISTSPFVSPVTGEVVAGVGFDRDARIFHQIEPALLQCVPDRETITDERAMEAYRFLADEWLVDVKTNAEGKAIAVTAALTIIQRIALDQRPAFFIIAGQRGGGKTTLAALIALATLGRKPAAASWASNEDERRKALLSHLRTGAASIVWDNIPRGALIKCPHLERALTSSEYSDRMLGVSEQVTVPSLTVMLFTGNNIAPAGDMASRALVCSIDVDRPDPENRTFVHPEPIGWTLNNRRRIMEALYTLLLWNPRLRLPESERPEAKTRFKIWWASIGASIEAVTALIGAPIDFGALLAANEVGDEETDGVATICDVVHRQFRTQVFSVKDLGALLNAGPEPVMGNPAEQAEWQARNDTASALREALQSIHDVPLPAGLLPNRRIGQILGKSVNRPVSVGGSTMRLRLVHKGHAGRTYQLEVL